MPKLKCFICNSKKGKRVCQINNNTLICPQCCAKTRNPECFGCRHYDQAERFSSEKEQEKEIYEQRKKMREDDFVIEIDEEVEENVDGALALVEQGKIAEGEQIIKKLYRKNPRNHITLYAMGVVNIFKDEKEQALPFFNKAIEIFPLFYEAWLNKGVLHKENYEIPEMVEAFRKVVELGNPKEREVREIKKLLSGLENNTQMTDNMTLDEYMQNHKRFDEAFKFMNKGQFQRAIDGFKNVIEVAPKHTQSFGNIGLCYAHIGERQKALEAFDKALELDPKYTPAIINREAVLRLKDGEKLQLNHSVEVDFYKDSFKKKKSILNFLRKK